MQDIESGAVVQVFKGHSACVWCLAIGGNYLFTGSDDKVGMGMVRICGD